MVLRRAFFHWLLPSAFLLPLWMVVGWAIFGQSGWALLWVLLIAVPSLFIGQLVLTLLTRSRPSVRAERAVSWWDVLGFAVWHGLTIAVACFIDGAFPWLLTGAIVAALKLMRPGQRMDLACLTPDVAKVFRLTRMDTIFTIHATLEDLAPRQAG